MPKNSSLWVLLSNSTRPPSASCSTEASSPKLNVPSSPPDGPPPSILLSTKLSTSINYSTSKTFRKSESPPGLDLQFPPNPPRPRVPNPASSVHPSLKKKKTTAETMDFASIAASRDTPPTTVLQRRTPLKNPAPRPQSRTLMAMFQLPLRSILFPFDPAVLPQPLATRKTGCLTPSGCRGVETCNSHIHIQSQPHIVKAYLSTGQNPILCYFYVVRQRRHLELHKRLPCPTTQPQTQSMSPCPRHRC